MYFSIVIPCYNNEKTLGRTLDSVLAQRNFVKEIILIDDGSTDNTALIARQYSDQHPEHVRYHHQTNSGPARARNQGARLATGEYTLFLDGDDTLCEGALETFHGSFEKEPDTQITLGGYCAVHETYRKDRLIKPYPGRQQLLTGLWFGEFSINGGMAAIRTALLRGIQYPEHIRHGEDIVFFSHLIAQHGARILPFVAVNIHHHADSLRNQQASILKDQDALIALLFDPRFIPPALMALQSQYHAKKLISLARTALKLKQKPIARQFLKKAFRLHPQSFVSFKTLKVCFRAW